MIDTGLLRQTVTGGWYLTRGYYPALPHPDTSHIDVGLPQRWLQLVQVTGWVSGAYQPMATVQGLPDGAWLELWRQIQLVMFVQQPTLLAGEDHD